MLFPFLGFGCSEAGQSKTAFVTFKDPKALEIALLLSVFLQICFTFLFACTGPDHSMFLGCNDYVFLLCIGFKCVAFGTDFTW